MDDLVFNNADAKPKTVKIKCDAGSVASIMAWYGSYFAGDRYTVALNGRNILMDLNGEPVGPIVTTTHQHRGESDE